MPDNRSRRAAYPGASRQVRPFPWPLAKTIFAVVLGRTLCRREAPRCRSRSPSMAKNRRASHPGRPGRGDPERGLKDRWPVVAHRDATDPGGFGADENARRMADLDRRSQTGHACPPQSSGGLAQGVGAGRPKIGRGRERIVALRVAQADRVGVGSLRPFSLRVRGYGGLACPNDKQRIGIITTWRSDRNACYGKCFVNQPTISIIRWFDSAN